MVMVMAILRTVSDASYCSHSVGQVCVAIQWTWICHMVMIMNMINTLGPLKSSWITMPCQVTRNEHVLSPGPKTDHLSPTLPVVHWISRLDNWSSKQLVMVLRCHFIWLRVLCLRVLCLHMLCLCLLCMRMLLYVCYVCMCYVCVCYVCVCYVCVCYVCVCYCMSAMSACAMSAMFMCAMSVCAMSADTQCE